MRRAIHPGEILAIEFLIPGRMTVDDLERMTGRRAEYWVLVCCGLRKVTRHDAKILGKALGTTPQFWTRLQQAYEANK